MKLLLATAALLSASSLRTCGKDESSNAAPATASAEARATGSAAGVAPVTALAAPRIGGNVALVGEFSVEVVVHQAGQIEALVTDAAGKARQDVQLSVSATTKGGATERVALAFSGPRGRFEGNAKAGVALASGPLAISLDAGGKALEAKVALVAALPTPKLGGHVLAAGGFASELFVRPSGEVQAFIRDAAGAELKAGANVKASVRTSAGASEDVALAFDAPCACFSGRAKAGLVPGPVKLSIDANGALGVGGLADVALSIDAAHGGQIVAVGDYNVELVAKGAEIHAFVFDATGKAHAAGDLALKLDLGAAAGGALALAWHAPSLSYRGRAAAGVNLSAAPLRLSLVAGGKTHLGAIASLKAAANANLGASAKADLGAKANLGANAKLKVPDVKAQLDASAAKAANASAKLQVNAPKVNVTPPKVDVSATKSAGAKAGTGAKASAGFSFGTK